MSVRNGDGPYHSARGASSPEGTLDFDNVTLRAFLDHDPRPTVVLDTRLHDTPPPTIVYRNKSLRQLYSDDIHFNDAFWSWVHADGDGNEGFREQNGAAWTKISLESRYTVITRNMPNTDSQGVAVPVRDATLMSLELSTRLDVRPSAYESLRSTLPSTDYIHFFLTFDWSKSSLGALDSWNDSMVSAARLLLSDPRPSAMMVGPDYCLIYNEAYFPIVGLRHPAALGRAFASVYSELPEFPAMLDTVSKGQPIHQDNTPFTLTRNDFSEEAWFSYTLIPLFEPNQNCFAIYNPVFETTVATVADRRMGLLTRLGMATAASRDVDGFWDSALEELQHQRNQGDVFFGSVYAPLVDDVSSASSSTAHGAVSGSVPGIKKLKLVGQWNVPLDHPIAADELKLEQSGLSPYFREASSGNRIVTLHSKDDLLIKDLLKGLEGLPGEPCTTLVLVPVKAIQADDIAGFVLCGINPRRPWDEDFATYLQILSNVMSSSMAAAVLVEEELRRSRIAAEVAAQEQQKLEAQLLFHLKRAKALNMRFTEFAEKSPIAIFVLDSEGRIVYANDLWREYTGYSLADDTPMGWLSILDMTQIENVEGIWHKLNVEHIPISYETRLTHARGKEEPPYVMCHAFPEVTEDGVIENIIGCFTDITPTKKAELLQQKRSEDAEAAKKLQEAFVDITSHELRNPMAVVLLECESIINSLASNGDVNSPLPLDVLKEDALSSTLDAAKTIMHCVTHQRRIVDDILTLSKLDSDLLPVAPIRSSVMECVNNVISMFVSEFKAADIAFELILTESFKELKVTDVYVDPSRLAQVFINLLTNAIKFTNTEATRKITVRLAASLTRPTESSTGVVYISQSKNVTRDDITEQAEWGNGAPIYLMFAVTDTGRGLTDSEKDILFRRFSQASPRTHVQYGGSGLGLYISRELTEKQGGQIGVASVAGSGSTFAFYIKSKRAEPLPTSHPLQNGTNYTQANNKRRAPATDIANADIPVLIVEDNLVNRRVLKKALTRLGFPILEAGHGEEALAIIKQSKYWTGQEETGTDIAVMLLDWEMPVLDGIGCIKKVREFEAQGLITAHLNTIAVTANARKEQIDIAMDAGMDDLISKPFTTELMVQQIKKWAAGRS